MDDDTETLQRRAVEAIVSLYRRSQMAGDEGRMFIVRRMFVPFEQEIGLIRTDKEEEIVSVMRWRELSHDDIRELSEDEILRLFEAA